MFSVPLVFSLLSDCSRLIGSVSEVLSPLNCRWGCCVCFLQVIDKCDAVVVGAGYSGKTLHRLCSLVVKCSKFRAGRERSEGDPDTKETFFDFFFFLLSF